MGGATGRPGAKLCPYFTLCVVRVYHYAISALCKGLYTITMRSGTSLHVLRITDFDHRRERRRLEYVFLTNAAATVRKRCE